MMKEVMDKSLSVVTTMQLNAITKVSVHFTQSEMEAFDHGMNS
jgi:hypothetical protein